MSKHAETKLNRTNLKKLGCLFESFIGAMYLDFNKIQINPLKVREYIDSTVDIYHKKLLNQLYGINIVYSEPDEDSFNN